MIARMLQILFPRARRRARELVFVTYAEGDRLLALDQGWRLAPEEDDNMVFGKVWLERAADPKDCSYP